MSLRARAATWLIVQAGTTNLYLPFVQGPVADRWRKVERKITEVIDTTYVQISAGDVPETGVRSVKGAATRSSAARSCRPRSLSRRRLPKRPKDRRALRRPRRKPKPLSRRSSMNRGKHWIEP